MLHVGSFDLADSLGFPSQLDHPEMLKCFERVIAACKKHGKTAGIGGVGGRPQLAEHVVRLGAQFISGGIDWDLMLGAGIQRVQSLRKIEAEVLGKKSD